MCGLCLPHCPTYRQTGDEGESPRGRISLMNALASGQLPRSPRLEAHLDHCLACRACEDVCPSQVPYGRLIDAGRTLLREGRPLSWPQRRLVQPALTAALTRRGVMRAAARLLRIAQRLGLVALSRRLAGERHGLLARLQHYLPPRLPKAGKWRAYYPPSGEERGRVALFLGCANPVLDPRGIDAAIRVLNRLGYGVHVPGGQVCCGALHLHSGRPATAARFARRNIGAFEAVDHEAVISLASGCGATLKEYPDLLQAQPPEPAAAFARTCTDISHFLARAAWPKALTLAPATLRVAVHDPCSLKRVLHQDAPVHGLLGRLPGARIEPLPGNAACCGAAGSYMLTQPEMADALRRDKLKALGERDTEVLVTSNIGCALHLAAGLRAEGSRVQVMHPVTLLDQYLEE